MDKEQNKKDIFDYWNGKKITVHKRISPDINKRLGSTLRSYTVEEVKAAIDFYATILEPELSKEAKDRGEGKYWWSYRWGLSDFLMRGLPKFDGQELTNYQRKQSMAAPEAVVLKRK